MATARGCVVLCPAAAGGTLSGRALTLGKTEARCPGPESSQCPQWPGDLEWAPDAVCPQLSDCVVPLKSGCISADPRVRAQARVSNPNLRCSSHVISEAGGLGT